MALEFNFSTVEVIELSPDIMNNLTDFTFSMWVFIKYPNGGNPCQLTFINSLDSDEGYFCNHSAMVLIGNGSVPRPTSNVWLHYTGVRNTAENKIDIIYDGTLVYSFGTASRTEPLDVKRIGVGNYISNVSG